MAGRKPRYADNPRLSHLRRIRDPYQRHQRAEQLQKHYQDLCNEAGAIKMYAVVDIYRESGEDYDATAVQLDAARGYIENAVRLFGDEQVARRIWLARDGDHLLEGRLGTAADEFGRKTYWVRLPGRILIIAGRRLTYTEVLAAANGDAQEAGRVWAEETENRRAAGL